MLIPFRKYLEEECGMTTADRPLLAVSGGLDSVVMAHLFRKAGFGFGLAHMNFSLRGREADGDEAFVQELAADWKLPFLSKRVDTAAYAREHGLSIQEAARELRYDWFRELTDGGEYTVVAVAHHRDDELETFFINLLRGTGLKGLTGYAARNMNIIRPLLFTGREELLHFAWQEGIQWREDSSNASDKYLRNRIRHDLLPLLEDLRPGSRDRLLDNIDRMSGENALLKVLTARPQGETDNEFSFRIPHGLPSRALPAFLASVLGPAAFPYGMMKDITLALGKAEARTFLSATHEVMVSGAELTVRPRRDPGSIHYIIKDEKDLGHLPIRLSMEIMDADKVDRLDQGHDIALLDADQLVWPLVLRHRKDGDRFRPLGLGGSKTLSDFLIDLKMSSFDRDKVWILESAGRIAWVVGIRMDHRFRVSAGTRTVIRMSK